MELELVLNASHAKLSPRVYIINQIVREKENQLKHDGPGSAKTWLILELIQIMFNLKLIGSIKQ